MTGTRTRVAVTYPPNLTSLRLLAQIRMNGHRGVELATELRGYLSTSLSAASVTVIIEEEGLRAAVKKVRPTNSSISFSSAMRESHNSHV